MTIGIARDSVRGQISAEQHTLSIASEAGCQDSP